MARIIVDSGSTKADWRIAFEEKVIAIQTIGLNPYFISHDEMISIVEEKIKPQTPHQKIENIFFYGAGCGADENKMKVLSVLKESFKDSDISVQTDLLGAARALLGNKEGLVVILGTGSNSGFYNGVEIIQNIDSLGYILGDEGSGANIGKLLLRDWLRKDFPKELESAFLKFCPISRHEILDRLYRQPQPNRFLAEFALFAIENRSNDHMKQILVNNFRSLISDVIPEYSNYKMYSINFVGSIADACAGIIKQVVKEAGLKMGRILKSPIEELTNYHLRQA